MDKHGLRRNLIIPNKGNSDLKPLISGCDVLTRMWYELGSWSFDSSIETTPIAALMSQGGARGGSGKYRDSAVTGNNAREDFATTWGHWTDRGSGRTNGF